MKTPSAVAVTPVTQILLVLENRHGMMARKSVLEEAGYQVSTASSAHDGVEQFSSSPFHMVITEYQLKGTTGVDLIAAIRAKKSGIPIILISGLVEALGLTEQNTGADVVIAKTNNEVTHLTRAVNRLLKRKPEKKPVRSQGSPRGSRSQIV
jgi:CheY-like chemotaxis protein